VTPGGPAALSQPASDVLTGFLILGCSVWVGGLISIFVVARVARRALPPVDRVAFFRGLGRAYGPVGGAALGVALGCGAALLWGRAWDATLAAAAAIAACLVAVTATGVAQARRMTRLRQDALAGHGDVTLDGRVRRGALGAAVLRAAIAALSLALVALGVVLAR
jgi:hypothetical protein